jgi:hypothetical protein
MSLAGATAAPDTGPAWMNEPARSPVHHRTGAHKRPGSGLATALFFGIIIAAVALAGAAGIAIWGPDKAPTNRTRLATSPPPPTELPSLPEEPPPAVVAQPAAEAPAEAPPVKKSVKARRAKHR